VQLETPRADGSSSPTQDGQDEKVGGGQEMAVMVGLWQKNFN